jgi:hypothetical protein
MQVIVKFLAYPHEQAGHFPQGDLYIADRLPQGFVPEMDNLFICQGLYAERVGDLFPDRHGEIKRVGNGAVKIENKRRNHDCRELPGKMLFVICCPIGTRRTGTEHLFQPV